jgi:hypothetical protein
VQYDIEPYTLPGWGAHPVDYRGWTRAVRALAAAARRPVHLVLPFWIADDEGGERLLREVAGSVSGVTAMAYRTDPAAIAQIAEPLLNWGAAARKPVRIALEAGPVAAEIEEAFRPAATGCWIETGGSRAPDCSHPAAAWWWKGPGSASWETRRGWCGRRSGYRRHSALGARFKECPTTASIGWRRPLVRPSTRRRPDLEQKACRRSWSAASGIGVGTGLL